MSRTDRLATALLFIIPCTCSQVLAAPDLYGLGDDSTGTTQLFRFAPTMPSGATAIGVTGVDDLAFLEYDPRNDWFVSKRLNQVYHIDPSTGVAAPFPSSTTYDLQGMAYIPSMDEMLIAIDTVPPGPEQEVGRLNADGTITPLFSLSTGLADIDEMFWDSVQQKFFASDTQASEIYEIDETIGSVVATVTTTPGELFRASVNPSDGLIYEVPGSSPAGLGTPVVHTRDPLTGNQIGTMGTIADIVDVRGLAFIPEPSTLLILAAGSLIMGRRRGRIA